MTEMILRPRTLTSAYGSSFRSDSSENKPGYCKASIFAVESSSATSGAYGKDAVTLLLRSCEDDGERATSIGVNPIGDEVRLSPTSCAFEIDAPMTLVEGRAVEVEV